MSSSNPLASAGPGKSLTTAILGLLVAPTAYLVASLLRPEACSPDQWLPIVTAALGAIAGAAVLERRGESGFTQALVSTMVYTAAFGIGLAVLLVVLPAGWRTANFGVFAEALAVKVQPATNQELADGPEIYKQYFVAAGLVALGGMLFGRGGALLALCLPIVAWSATLAQLTMDRGGMVHGAVPALRAAAASAPYLIPSFLGMCLVGCGTRMTVARFLGTSRDVDVSLRPTMLGLGLGLLCMAVAGSIDLFGGGMLSRLLGN